MLALQAIEITIMPVLSGQSEESEFWGSLGIHRQQGHSGHGYSHTGEPQKAFHVHRQVASDHS